MTHLLLWHTMAGGRAGCAAAYSEPHRTNPGAEGEQGTRGWGKLVGSVGEMGAETVRWEEVRENRSENKEWKIHGKVMHVKEFVLGSNREGSKVDFPLGFSVFLFQFSVLAKMLLLTVLRS